MVTSCLEQETKSIVKKMTNVCAGWMSDLWFMQWILTLWSCLEEIRHNYIVVNKPFKNHLEQLYSEWLLGGHYVLTPSGTIRKPSTELPCQWVKITATDLSRSGDHRI
jgi:hypothetical protein